MTASSSMSLVFALCLLSVATAANAGNREPRMHGPGGEGGCTTTECTETETGAAPDVTAAPVGAAAKSGATTSSAKPAATTTHAKPVITTVRGGSEDAGTHAPRWHSFLPGMFR